MLVWGNRVKRPTDKKPLFSAHVALSWVPSPEMDLVLDAGARSLCKLHNKNSREGDSADERIPQHGRSADERIPQHGCSADERIPQHGCSADERIPQHGCSADERIPRHGLSADERIPQHGCSTDERIPQHGYSADERIPQHGPSAGLGWAVSAALRRRPQLRAMPAVHVSDVIFSKGHLNEAILV
ncbi:hypothetical protein U0070_003019 [Myodes glareolus]|uniref:Uncharacterized protein n=1 Tax=Myodes glareolus TaxID=447135 RepID=A0AAW0HSE3_MYOGA